MTIFNYTVNYFDVGIVAIVVIASLIGWKRGAAIGVVNFIRSSVGFFLCFYLSSNLAKPIYDNYARQKCLDLINREIADSNNIDKTINNLNEYIKSLPDFVSSGLNIKSIDISSAKIAESILDNIFEPFVTVLIKIIVFVLVFILFFGATAIIISAVRKSIRKKEQRRGKRSALRKTDKVFGMIFGAVKSFVIIFAISAVIMYFIGLDENAVKTSGFLREANSSSLMQYINEINPFNAITEGLV